MSKSESRTSKKTKVKSEPQAIKKSGTKRKHEDEDTRPTEGSSSEDEKSSLPLSKKTKSSESVPINKDEIDSSIATLTPATLSAKFSQTTLQHTPSLTPIELTDLSLPTTSFTDTTSFPHTRTLEHLPTFLTTYTSNGLSGLQSPPSTAGTPHTLLLTTSAIRCTTLLRPIRHFGTSESKIAKLFAKHMKLAAMENYVKNTKFGIAAGTPGRVGQLIGSGVLKVGELKRVVIDGSYMDGKKRGVWSDQETWIKIVEVLNSDEVKMRLVKGEAEILVY